MIDLQIEFDKRQFAEIMDKVSLLADEKEIQKAINRAAKRAADTAKAETVRQLGAEYTLPVSEIRESISVRNLAAGGATMRISSGPFPLTKFEGTLPQDVMPPAKGPVRVQVKKKSGGKVLDRSFVAKMKNGHKGVYERKTEKRLPLEQHFGPSIPGMFGRENETGINTAVRQKAMETFKKRVIHEFERLMYG